MSASFVQYLGDGVTRLFQVPFDYLSKSHVTVTVSGVDVVPVWEGNQAIRLPTAPAVDAIVELLRKSPGETRLVDFADGSVLTEYDLDLSARQLLFVGQEASDKAARALGLTPTGKFDARGLEIVNAAPPKSDNSVATRSWTEQAIDESVQGLADRTVFYFVERDPSASAPAEGSNALNPISAKRAREALGMGKVDNLSGKEIQTTVEFPVYSGGALRNSIDRSIETINVADMPGGTTGSPADDDAAIAYALQIAGGQGARKQVVLGGSPLSGVRNWQSLRQHVVTEGTSILGTSPDQAIVPLDRQAGKSVFLVTGGRTEIAYLMAAAHGDYAAFDFIQVRKPHDGVKPVKIHDIFAFGFRNFVRWWDGDCPRIYNCESLNHHIAVNYVNNGTSGFHSDNTFQGGGGIFYGKSAENLSPIGSHGRQQAEGCVWQATDVLVARKTGVDGLPVQSALQMFGGYDITFDMVCFSEVWAGNAVSLVGSSLDPNYNINFRDCYIAANVNNRDASGLVGVAMSGPSKSISFKGGQINGFTDQGASINGTEGSPHLSPGNILFEGVKFGNNGRSSNAACCDVFYANMGDKLSLNGNDFDSGPDVNVGGIGNANSTSIYGIASSTEGTGNRFRLQPVFSNKLYNLDRCSGPGAHVGIPTFESIADAVAAGLPVGWWFQTSAGILRRVGVGG